jgi:sarcosine oxidase subunit alpha
VDLFDLGLKINCVADIREDGQNPELLLALAERKIPVLRGWVAAKAHGSKQVEKRHPCHPERHRQASLHLRPAGGLRRPHAGNGPFILAQAKMGYDSRTGYFLPTRKLPEKMFPAGRITGINDPDAIEASGRLAGFSRPPPPPGLMWGSVTVRPKRPLRPCPDRSAAANWSPPR